MERTFPHLSNAPIQEALVDIRVEPRADLDVAALTQFLEEVRGEFPDVKPIRTLRVQLSDAGAEQIPTEMGSICWNESKTAAVQARLDGFTFNCVRDYNTWVSLRERAHVLWTKYLAVARPLRVTKCTLRYVNRIAVAVHEDLSVSFETRPEVGSLLPQLLDGYLMKLGVPFGDERQAMISQASEPMAQPSPTRNIILDIDAFSTRSFEPSDDVAIWGELDVLRGIKNQCFFDSLKKSKWSSYI